jgi:hypothetical protein
MATKRWIVVGVGALLSSASCDLNQPEEQSYCRDTHKECSLTYSAFSGYQRSCSSISNTCGPKFGTEASRPAPAVDAGVTASSPNRPPARPDPGPAPLPDTERYSAFDLACTRDSQCGPGKCLQGACYYGCQSDSQCGTGDRCGTEQGTRICLPDPNPPVSCTRSAQCDRGHECLNGTCMQTCTTTDQCTNLVDRCASGVCQPDRRPLGECVLTSECSKGFVCLDGACVDACASAGDAGVCLPGAGVPVSPTPPSGTTGEQLPPGIPLASVDAGHATSAPDSTAPSDLSSAPIDEGNAGNTDDTAVAPEGPPEAPSSDEPDAGSSDLSQE